jgi:hypothetical protein
MYQGRNDESHQRGARSSPQEKEQMELMNKNLDQGRRDVVMSYAVKGGVRGKCQTPTPACGDAGLGRGMQRMALILEREEGHVGEGHVCSIEERGEAVGGVTNVTSQQCHDTCGALNTNGQGEVVCESLHANLGEEPVEGENTSGGLALERHTKQEGAAPNDHAGGNADLMELCGDEQEEERSEVSQATLALFPWRFSSARPRDSPRTPRSAFRQPHQKKEDLAQGLRDGAFPGNTNGDGGWRPEDEKGGLPTGCDALLRNVSLASTCPHTDEQQQQRKAVVMNTRASDEELEGGMEADMGPGWCMKGRGGWWRGRGGQGHVLEQQGAVYAVTREELMCDGVTNEAPAAALLQRHLTRFAEEVSKKVGGQRKQMGDARKFCGQNKAYVYSRGQVIPRVADCCVLLVCWRLKVLA